MAGFGVILVSLLADSDKVATALGPPATPNHQRNDSAKVCKLQSEMAVFLYLAKETDHASAWGAACGEEWLAEQIWKIQVLSVATFGLAMLMVSRSATRNKIST